MNRLVVALLVAAVGARAEELLTPGEQVHRELTAALAASDAQHAVPLCAEAAEIYLCPCTKAEAESLLSLLGTATRSEDKTIAVAALRALGRTGAPGAAAFVEPFLRGIKKGEEKTVLAAIRTAGRIAAPNLIPDLLDLSRDCPDLAVAEQALLALGGYAVSPRDVRERAVRETLQLSQLLSKRPQRWRQLEWPALRALQRLTGKKLNSVEQFSDWWRIAKARKDPFE